MCDLCGIYGSWGGVPVYMLLAFINRDFAWTSPSLFQNKRGCGAMTGGVVLFFYGVLPFLPFLSIWRFLYIFESGRSALQSTVLSHVCPGQSIPML